MELNELVNKLRALGIKTVVAEYDGSGDSGEVHSMSFSPDVQIPDDIYEAVQEAAHTYLDELGIDWYNDEGGYGTYTLDVANGAQGLEHSERVMETQNSSYRDGIDLSGDEDEQDAESAPEAPVCTCPTLIGGHHANCPYAQSRGA